MGNRVEKDRVVVLKELSLVGEANNDEQHQKNNYGQARLQVLGDLRRVCVGS